MSYTCMPCMYALYDCLTYMPYTYALHVTGEARLGHLLYATGATSTLFDPNNAAPGGGGGGGGGGLPRL